MLPDGVVATSTSTGLWGHANQINFWSLVVLAHEAYMDEPFENPVEITYHPDTSGVLF